VRHRNLVNYSHFIQQRLELEKYPQGLHFATVSTLGADLGNTCIYPALISGGCLHVISYSVSTDSQRFANYTRQYPLDVLKIVPSHLQALLDSAEARQVLPRKYLILGGETLSAQLVEKIQNLNASCEILNHYGPTETTVGSLTLRLKEFDQKQFPSSSIPIGRPFANTQLYILDAHQQAVPVGVVGELYIAGAGVTAGYLKLLIELLRPADSQVDRNWMIGLQPSGMWTRQTEIHSRPVQSRRLLLRLRHPALQPPVAPRRPLVVNRRAPTKTARPAQPNSTKRVLVVATPALQFR